MQDPSAFDFLSQHGQKVPGGTSAAAALARESLYRKFDPLIQGRQSIMPPKEQRVTDDGDTNHRESENLIAMNSPDAKSSTSNSGRQQMNSLHNRTPSSTSSSNSLLHHQQSRQSCDSNNLKNNNSNHTNDNEDMDDEEEEEERAHVAQVWPLKLTFSFLYKVIDDLP